MTKEYLNAFINNKKSKDLIPGGRADKKPISAFPPDQIKKGIKVEMEHTNNPRLAKEIAKDHLTEDKKYYTKLIKMEKSARDTAVMPEGFDYNSKAYSHAKSLGNKHDIDPRLVEENAGNVRSMASANPRKNNMVIKMLSVDLDNQDPINRQDKMTHRVVKDASSAAEQDQLHYHAWKTNPTPETLNNLMKRFDPIVNTEASKWKQSGINPVILRSKARDFTYQALQNYDPNKNIQLNTHITNNLKQMSRFVINNQNAIRVPEEQIYGYRSYLKTQDQLEQELNRQPTHLEVKERMNEQGKTFNNFVPIIENFYSKASEGDAAPVMEELSHNVTGIAIMFDNLDKTEKYIFKHSYGYQGAPQKSNLEIAKDLGISAAAISKRKNVMEKKYKAISDPMSRFLSD